MTGRWEQCLVLHFWKDLVTLVEFLRWAVLFHALFSETAVNCPLHCHNY